MKRIISIFLSYIIAITIVPCFSVYASTSDDYHISQAGLEFLCELEGFHETCYVDGTQSSIGFGTKCTGSSQQPHASGSHTITIEQAYADMTSQLYDRYEPNVRRQTSGISMSQNQFDALTSLCYNTGGGNTIISDSPLVQYLIGNLSEDDARNQYSEYIVKSNGKRLQGLVNRRNKEADWFFSGGGGHDCYDYGLDIPYCRPSGSSLIQKGSKGHYVGWVQTALERLGYDVGGVDCDFGGNTDSAVRTFQSDYGLEVDGQVGSETIAKIVELLKKPDDTEAPVISNAQVFDIDATGYSIKCTVTDNVGVTKVQFPTWTENNGQDDLIWHDASVSGNTYSYRISVSDHNNEYGRYVTHIYAWDAAGNSTSAGGADFELKVGSKMDKGAGQTIPDGDYYIFSGLMDNYYLDIDGSEVPAESKTSVHMWTSSSDKLPPECDAWTVKHEGNGFYTISQKGAPICLDLYGANPTRGASICVHTANGSDAQLWSISSTGKGYSIQAKCSGYCLDVYGSEKNNGTAVLVWEATNNPNQEWMFVPLLEAPQTSIIKADKKSVLVGESITFSAESDTASDYTIIVKSGADEVLQQKMVNGKASLSFTDAADYTAYVTAYNEKGSIDSGTIKFNVTSNIIIQEGDSFQIPITDEKLTYKSHNTNVATVSKDGLITGKQKGTTVVSVVTKDNDVIQYTVNVIEAFIEGDCNSDGNFDIADVVLLQKWLLTEVKTLENWKAADFSQDNRLDVFDLCLMKRKLING